MKILPCTSMQLESSVFLAQRMIEANTLLHIHVLLICVWEELYSSQHTNAGYEIAACCI